LSHLLPLLGLQSGNLLLLLGLSFHLLLVKPCHLCLLGSDGGLHGPFLCGHTFTLLLGCAFSSPLTTLGFFLVVPVVASP